MLLALCHAAIHVLLPLPRAVRADFAAAADDILVTVHENGLAHVLLNRPRAINALSTSMLQELLDVLDSAERPEESGVRCIAISGAGERGFCAGGDIKHVAALASGESLDGLARRGEAGDEVVLGVRSPQRAQDYLRLEYAVDELLRRADVPVVTVGHGLIYGGGQGLWAGSERFRVAAADATLAMPEAVIGIVPDAGSTAFLRTHLRSRAEHLYVALAGTPAALDTAALAARGLASWVAPGGGAASAEAVIAALAAALPPPGQQGWPEAAVAEALESAGCVEQGAWRAAQVAACFVEQEEAEEAEAGQETRQQAGSVWAARGEQIATCFAEPTPEAVLSKLRALAQGGEGAAEAAAAAWAARTAAAIERGCPASLVCTAALVARAWAEARPPRGDGSGGGGGEEEGGAGGGHPAYALRLRAALDAEYRLNAALGLRPDFAEGVACAVGARRGEAPSWRPSRLEDVHQDAEVRAALDAAGLSEWT